MLFNSLEFAVFLVLVYLVLILGVNKADHFISFQF